MIRAAQRKVNRELTLVVSERTRQNACLPTGWNGEEKKRKTEFKVTRAVAVKKTTKKLKNKLFCVWSELWKKSPLRCSLSPERPQIVETFAAQLMDGAEQVEGQVGRRTRTM